MPTLYKKQNVSNKNINLLAGKRYKTEQCRSFEERGRCKYGNRCHFAHGSHEQRFLARHPKYKTELCRGFHMVGFCAYGRRCHFIHNKEEPCLGGRMVYLPKYKTELCRGFHLIGFCPYGRCCHFIHNKEEEIIPIKKQQTLRHPTTQLLQQLNFYIGLNLNMSAFWQISRRSIV